MKVFKNKKQRFVAVFLSLVFAFMLVPFTDVYARDIVVVKHGSSYDFDYYKNDKLVHNLSYNFSSPSGANIVIVGIKKPNGDITYGAYSLSPDINFTFTSSTGSATGAQATHVNVDGEKLYFVDFLNAFKDGSNYTFKPTDLSFPYYLVNYYFDDNYNAIHYRYIVALLKAGDTTGFDCTYAGSEGGIENPIYDEDIGTLIISKSKMYEESNGEDVNDLYNLFSWKMKTNTGFSLSDNKYARTFIQVRVESKCVVYDDRRHTKIHKNFDNYGEKAMLINSHPVDSQPLKISYLTDIPNVLPKTHAEIHNPVFTGYNYTLYFRVVCTDDLAVIPSDSSEWHCGGWRALDCNADILVGQSDTTENGSFDDEDNWVKDEDDGNNSIESGSDSVHDTDDAKDDFNNSSSAVDSSVNGAISTMQSLLDMIRHVPQIISTIFSFLPNWCLNIVGLAFVALVVLIIYKLVRG
ncbi:MAG: hypothetical protein SPE81_04570 [Agathobacter sp.]|nr:hypothetical protein [Agathobacter sp.]